MRTYADNKQSQLANLQNLCSFKVCFSFSAGLPTEARRRLPSSSHTLPDDVHVQSAL